MALDPRLGSEIIYDFYGSSSFINITARLQSPYGCGEQAWYRVCYRFRQSWWVFYDQNFGLKKRRGDTEVSRNTIDSYADRMML